MRLSRFLKIAIDNESLTSWGSAFHCWMPRKLNKFVCTPLSPSFAKIRSSSNTSIFQLSVSIEYVSLYSIITCYRLWFIAETLNSNDEIMIKKVIAFSCFYLPPDFKKSQTACISCQLCYGFNPKKNVFLKSAIIKLSSCL